MREKLFLFITILWATQVSAAGKKLVDCRYISPKTTECMPYPSKFMYPKKLSTGKHIDFHKSHKLIVSKTVPVIEKPKIMNIISVEDMIEKHLVVLEPSRFAEVKSHSPIVFSTDVDKNETLIEDSNISIVQDSNVTEIVDENMTLVEDSNITTVEDANKTEIVVVEKIEKPLVEKKKKVVIKKKKYPKYKVEKDDTLGHIAKLFDLPAKKILAINTLGRGGRLLRVGQDVNIPLSTYKFNKIIKKEKREKKKSLLAKKLYQKNMAIRKRPKTLNEYGKKLVSAVRGKHSLRVQATAYTSHGKQTDKTPFLAAWNNRIRPGMKIIAVSRDLIYKYGLGNGKRVRIQGLPGYYTVRDKMNKRYKKRIDIYMGMNRRKALRWGRRSVVIYW